MYWIGLASVGAFLWASQVQVVFDTVLPFFSFVLNLSALLWGASGFVHGG